MRLELIKFHSIAFLWYIILSTGKIFPYDVDGGEKLIIGGAVFFLLLIISISLNSSIYYAGHIKIFMWVASIFCVGGLIQSAEVGMALDKIQGGVFASIVISIIFLYSTQALSFNKFLQILINVGVGFLAATVLFKISNGFFDRGVRFLLNGPIVFGWLMGFFSIISLYELINVQARRYFIAAFVFFLAMVWTESKGPIVGYFVAVIFYFIRRLTVRGVLAVILLIAIAWFVLNVYWQNIEEIVENNRLLAAMRFFDGNEKDYDYGSFGARELMFQEAFSSFKSNLFFGIGLGNFYYDGFYYPHNQHLEIGLEMGIFALAMHLLLICYSLFKVGDIFRALIIFFFIGASFSGDFSYMRFLYSMCLIGLACSYGAKTNRRIYE